MLPSKKITFSEYAIDILVIKDMPAYSKQEELLRPLRLLPDGQVGVLYKEKVYPLYLDSNSKTTVLLSGAVYETKNTTLPGSLPITTELRFIEIPLRFKFADELNWNIERNQFGVYIYVSANDEIVEYLVSLLVEQNKFNVLSWGENINPAWANEFSWNIRLSSGISIDTVRNTLVELISSEAFTNLLSESKVQSLAKNREAEILRFQGQSKEFNQSINTVNQSIETLSEEKNLQIEDKNKEISYLYDEIERLSNAIETLFEENLTLQANNSVNLSSKVIRRGAAERVLANALHTCFPALAFSPDVVNELQARFTGSSAIWTTFERLNAQSEMPLEKLGGLAGKAGWLEVRKHINTGNDNRGRVYCRKSKKTHNFDVIIHWKKDNKDQEKILKKLANYEAFETTDTVFM